MSIFLTGLTGLTGFAGYFLPFQPPAWKPYRQEAGKAKRTIPLREEGKRAGCQEHAARRRSNELWRVSPKVTRETKR